jgi:hypothetical protein
LESDDNKWHKVKLVMIAHIVWCRFYMMIFKRYLCWGPWTVVNMVATLCAALKKNISAAAMQWLYTPKHANAPWWPVE